jgi:rhodanese-related sulfurtransferase
MKTATVREVYDLMQQGRTIDLIDVRTPPEFAEARAVGAVNLPLDTLDPAVCVKQRRAAADEPIYLICRSGGRSQKAGDFFIAAGFPNVVNVVGGTLAWIEADLPNIRGDGNAPLSKAQATIP